MLFILLLKGPIQINKVYFDIHTMVFAGITTLIGYMLLVFGSITRIIGISLGLLPPKRILDYLSGKPILEIGSLLGVISMLTGFLWDNSDYRVGQHPLWYA